jgi:hypothetical protein
VRISVLTFNGSRYGLKLLNLLQWNGVPVDQVVVRTDVWRRRARWLQRAARRIGWPEALIYAGWRLRSPFFRQRDVWRGRPLELDYRRLTARVDHISLPWSMAVGVLRSAGPDLCLLAETGIVPASILAVPRLATLNAHPGLLPDFRGIDAYMWAIHEERFDRVGCSLHLVDEGVDTGDILQTRAYHWIGDETLGRLAWRLNETCLDLLAEACQAPWPQLANTAIAQGEGRLYYLMPPRLWPGVKRKLRRFLSARARPVETGPPGPRLPPIPPTAARS